MELADGLYIEEYKKIYDEYISDVYKEHVGGTLENFLNTSFVKKVTNDDYSFRPVGYAKLEADEYNIIACTVEFTGLNDEIVTEKIVLMEYSPGQYKVSFEELVKGRKVNKQEEKDGVIIKVLNENHLLDQLVYEVEIRNYGNSTVYIKNSSENKKIYVEYRSGNALIPKYCEEVVDIILESGETKNINIVFPVKFDLNTNYRKIYFKEITDSIEQFSIGI